jgi:hypothetical protein
MNDNHTMPSSAINYKTVGMCALRVADTPCNIGAVCIIWEASYRDAFCYEEHAAMNQLRGFIQCYKRGTSYPPSFKKIQFTAIIPAAIAPAA